MLDVKIVDFGKYCPKCKYIKNDETEDPCRECIYHVAVQHSRKPVKFVEETRRNMKHK